ncbi:hypothetical protein JCM10212_003669 [Sporobolomyces blumeae]
MLSTLALSRTRLVPHSAAVTFTRSLATASSRRFQSAHSYQPHPADPKLSSKEGSPPAAQWKPSRPHEQWLLSSPVYTKDDVNAIDVIYLEPKSLGDKIARGLVSFARKGFDIVTGYKHASPQAGQAALAQDGKGELSLDEKRKQGYVLTEAQWMSRILFLESIAGVPGFCAAILRHLRSLRLMKRDGGWINELLVEAENERMHLLTFMKIGKPSRFFRLMVLGAQGVFFNFFFLGYMISPRAAHRFVAYLEEEACYTYTHAIEALDRGEIPEWSDGKKAVPTVAKDYWRLSDNATMRDLLLAVRADEAGHRFVNHTLSNLEKDDFNPVALKHPSTNVIGTKLGFTREEGIKWLQDVEKEMKGQSTDAKAVEGGGARVGQSEVEK